MVSFVCNICGQSNTIEAMDQEASSCAECGSNVRLRALIYMLSTELFGDGYLLPDFPRLPAIAGLGLSDQSSYARRLEKKFDYVNTYYDREPRFDIAAAHPERRGTYDFILSSDVFEHVAAPVERAFEEAYNLLKPHGVLCLTAPFSLHERTVERFPDLHHHAVVDLSGSLVLINRNKQGALEIRDDLIFHGGAGDGHGPALEMRLFSQRDLQAKLLEAGFQSIVFQTEAVPRFGIAFTGTWSLPLVARKDEFFFDKRAVGQFASEYDTRMKDLAKARAAYDEAIDRLTQRDRQVDRLDAELAERGGWALRVQEELDEARRHLARSQAEFEERTRWALQLQREAEAETRTAAELRAQLDAVSDSRWVKLGNRFGIGPKLKGPA
jgi:SAM-dependent methyltransferase